MRFKKKKREEKLLLHPPSGCVFQVFKSTQPFRLALMKTNNAAEGRELLIESLFVLFLYYHNVISV